MDMAIPRPLGQTCTKLFDQHVLELSTAALRPPSTIPLFLAHPTARSRRSPAGQLTVEQLACVPAPKPPQPTRARPRRSRPPARAHATPLPPLTRLRASPAPHGANHGWPHVARVARVHAAPPRAPHCPELLRLFKHLPWPLPSITPPPHHSPFTQVQPERSSMSSISSHSAAKPCRHCGSSPATPPVPRCSPRPLPPPCTLAADDRRRQVASPGLPLSLLFSVRREEEDGCEP